MSSRVITEPGYARFSLTYPAVTDNAASAEDLNGGDMTVPFALVGILVPHLVCTLFILARAYSRISLLRRWFLDDSLILLAWATSTAVCIVYSISAILSGSHLGYLDRDENDNSVSPAAIAIPVSTSPYIALILYQFAHLSIKLSTLASYYRIFSSSEGSRRASQAERTLTCLTGVAVVLYILPLLALTVLQCHHDHAFSPPSSPPSLSSARDRCAASVPFKTLVITSTVLHAAADVWLLALILRRVLRLRVLPRRDRTMLAGVLSLAVCVVVAAGMVRLAVALRLAAGGGFSPPAESPAFFVVTVLELDLAVVCASAPALRPLLARLLPKRGAVGGDGRGGVGLASVVRRHDQRPWLRDPPASPSSTSSPPPGTPLAGERAGKGRSAARARVAGAVQVPHVSPPPPVRATPRAPGMSSLRSFVHGMRPGSVTARGLGQPDWESRAQLLGREVHQGDGRGWKRRSSVGIEVYYERLVGYGDGEGRGTQDAARRSLDSRRSSAASAYTGRWADSQESLVLGVNDPNSPKRRSPISRLGELTRAETRTRGRGDSQRRDDGAMRGWQEQSELMMHRAHHPDRWDG
ncbi:hypothetical protein VTH06DRAFT_7196 [Thermothelomyces fergusii]